VLVELAEKRWLPWTLLFFASPVLRGRGREGESLKGDLEDFRSETCRRPYCSLPPPALRATSPV